MNGWLDLYIGARSVEIMHVDATAPMVCACGSDSGKDLMVVVRVFAAEKSCNLVGWIDRERITALRNEGLNPIEAHLLPMENLKRIARDEGVHYAQ